MMQSIRGLTTRKETRRPKSSSNQRRGPQQNINLHKPSWRNREVPYKPTNAVPVETDGEITTAVEIVRPNQYPRQADCQRQGARRYWHPRRGEGTPSLSPRKASLRRQRREVKTTGTGVLVPVVKLLQALRADPDDPDTRIWLPLRASVPVMESGTCASSCSSSSSSCTGSSSALTLP